MRRIIIFLVQLLLVGSALGRNEAGTGGVLLRDVGALTLRGDRHTLGRRISPAPQLRCVGGSAGCKASATPQVVQCVNKGWDGATVQWQCKADMENLYRFGDLEIHCEGYSHPDDDYVLPGSCRLEYKLELTEAGLSKSRAVAVIMLAFIAYFVFRIARAIIIGQPNQPSVNVYIVGDGGDYSTVSTAESGGGFWSGLWTGGALGYLFRGGRSRTESDNSTRTRTASGFGGTKVS